MAAVCPEYILIFRQIVFCKSRMSRVVKEGNDVTNELCSDQGNEKEKKHSLKYRVGRNRDKTQKKEWERA